MPATDIQESRAAAAAMHPLTATFRDHRTEGRYLLLFLDEDARQLYFLVLLFLVPTIAFLLNDFSSIRSRGTLAPDAVEGTRAFFEKRPPNWNDA